MCINVPKHFTQDGTSKQLDFQEQLLTVGRSALTPTTAKALIDAGYKVNVERSPQRIFDDEEFSRVGATLVPENSWPDAPEDTIIVGLKELPVESCKSMHKNAVDDS